METRATLCPKCHKIEDAEIFRDKDSNRIESLLLPCGYSVHDPLNDVEFMSLQVDMYNRPIEERKPSIAIVIDEFSKLTDEQVDMLVQMIEDRNQRRLQHIPRE